MTQRCRSCGAPILWAKTIRGRRMPLDPTPTDEGNIVYDAALEVASVLRDPQLVEARFKGTDLYLSHFATCPNASSHRRR